MCGAAVAGELVLDPVPPVHEHNGESVELVPSAEWTPATSPCEELGVRWKAQR